MFDERFFLYYEDTDLSWRGRLAAGATGTCRRPSCATSTPRAQEGSTCFPHFVERNRFLTLARNAPWSMLAAAYVYPPRHPVIVKDVGRRAGRAPATGAPGSRCVGSVPTPGSSSLRRPRCDSSGAGGRSVRPRRVVERWGVPR